MFAGNALAGEIPSAAHYIISKLACGSGTPPQKDCSSNPLSALKSLAQWALRVTSSTKPLLSSPQYDNRTHQKLPKRTFSLTRHASDTPFVFMICVSSVTVQNAAANASSTRQGTSLLIIYAVDKLGTFELVGSLYFRTSYQVFETSPWRVYCESAKSCLLSHPRQRSLKCIFYFLETSSFLNAFKIGLRKFSAYISYGLERRIGSLFGFLRYNGPRLLRSSRRIVLDVDDYQITHIGQGAFAVISRVLHRPSGEVRVMKRITFDKTGLAEYLAKNEVDALKAISGNAWFPLLLNSFEEGNEFVVTMPFYQRGDLAGLIEHKGYLGRELARFYSAQLVLAIHSLHKVGIIHRDIKTDNIFLDEQGNLILADLGLAENIASYEGGEEMMKYFPEWLEARDKGGDSFPFLWVNHRNPLAMIGSAGTFWYTAPEVFRKERYSFGVDYWSVGVIYYELITGHIPFNHYKPYPENKRPELDFRIKPGQLKDVEHWEEEALTEFLNPHPAYRPRTLTDMKNSPIFDGVDWDRVSSREILAPLLPRPLKEG